MTNKEIIDQLERIANPEPWEQQINMAIALLNKMHFDGRIANYNDYFILRNAISSISMQSKIIRCKDCKHRGPEDKKCDCGHDILWQLPRDDDWFCADAERGEVHHGSD